jgi:hypothetical protein
MLNLRSALGSYGFSQHFPKHSIDLVPTQIAPSGALFCQWCGFYDFPRPHKEDLNRLNFERHKWGGVRRDDLVYAWLDFKLFRQEQNFQEPTVNDRETMRQILDIAGSLEPAASASKLEKSLMGRFKSSANERRVLIEILATCGILQPRNRSGYSDEFTYAFEREHTGQHFNDWSYPAIWWRGSDGVNQTAVAKYFPNL